MDKANIIAKVCDLIESGKKALGEELLNSNYPFKKTEYVKRNYSKADMLSIFIRDRFIDRYSGDKVLLPPVLRILSEIYPNEFPFHPNWKYNECHPAYWDLLPTIDHITPVSLGGKNDKENLVTTSMKRNSAKSNFTLKDLGWDLHPPGNSEDWDGKLSWFLGMIKVYPFLLKIPYIKQWYTYC
ncbi:HNH endonuclease [Bacillus sp. AFS053548]|uniref:HNH endonuclease n=1 Tax=Bacillus sp. AFS053548 TaxID=2033505 RepID=UPI000BFD5DDB|nr:HNH endonuclease [Bacillus sp. AFS053548]PGM53832.1 HNH endonuclease [Bacillus sp. AFS053548]